MTDRVLFALAAGFVAGVAVSSFVRFGFSFVLALFLIATACIVFRARAVGPSAGRSVLLLALFLFAFALGVLRYGASGPADDPRLDAALGTRISIAGVIARDPALGQSRTQLVIDARQLIADGTNTPVTGRILVSAARSPQFSYGDFVNVSGTLARPENFAVAGGAKEFDYVSYLGKDSIGYTIDFASVAKVSSGNGNPILASLFSVRNAFLAKLGAVLPEPEAGFAAGILLGDQNAMDPSAAADFRAAGLSHVTALSGYNVSVVADAVMAALAFLPRIAALSAGALGISAFVLMTGASSTAVRAGIMALIVLLAAATRREAHAGRLLVLAAIIMILLNPRVLVSDISFQLSFLATAAVIYAAPVLKRRFGFLPERFGLRETAAATIAAQIFVLPLILFDMGSLSFVSVPANLLVLPAIPAGMLGGMLAGAAGFVSSGLAAPVAWIAYVPLAYAVIAAHLFAAVPFSSVAVPWFSGGCMIAAYAAIAVWMYRARASSFARHAA